MSVLTANISDRYGLAIVPGKENLSLGHQTPFPPYCQSFKPRFQGHPQTLGVLAILLKRERVLVIFLVQERRFSLIDMRKREEV